MIQSPWIHDVTATVEPVDPPTPSEPGGHSGHGAPDLDAGGDLPSIPAMFLDWSWATGPLAIGVVMIAAYTLGVAVLRRRGDRWPWWRSASWLAGVLSLWSVTVTAIGGYGMAMFSAHMVQHMVVGMLTPILLLVGAPVTLGLRALPATPARRGAPRRLLLAVLHSRAAAVVTSPVVTVGLFIASLYALYFTPMLDLAMGTGLGHTLMLVHFVAVGLLFFGPVLAVDPWPRRHSPGVRLVEMVAAVPFHAFFGIAVMSATTPLSSEFAQRSAALGIDTIEDQSVGGAIAWGFGEIPIVLVATVVFVQWVREDRRAARRFDRQSNRDNDAALAAHNQRLRELAEAHRRYQQQNVAGSRPLESSSSSDSTK